MNREPTIVNCLIPGPVFLLSQEYDSYKDDEDPQKNGPHGYLFVAVFFKGPEEEVQTKQYSSYDDQYGSKSSHQVFSTCRP